MVIMEINQIIIGLCISPHFPFLCDLLLYLSALCRPFREIIGLQVQVRYRLLSKRWPEPLSECASAAWVPYWESTHLQTLKNTMAFCVSEMVQNEEKKWLQLLCVAGWSRSVMELWDYTAVQFSRQSLINCFLMYMQYF